VAAKKSAKKVEKPDAVHVTVKASREWKEWLDGLAAHCRTDVSKLIDAALIRHARAEGYEPEPPVR
jgi:hypothetical protein